MAVRTSQTTTEVVRDAVTPARVSQSVLEVVHGGADDTPVRASQATMEVVRSGAGRNVRVTQACLEVVRDIESFSGYVSIVAQGLF